MGNLLELSRQVSDIEMLAIESNGEITPEIERLLDRARAEITQKVDAYDFIIKSLQVRAEFLDKEAGRRWLASEHILKLIDRLKLNLKNAMLDMQVKQLQGETVKFNLIRSRDKLIFNESKLPHEYCDIITTKVANRDRILAALTAGKTIPGVNVESGYHLRSYIKSKDE